MVRSRAMSAREPGQVRKEAALSGSEQATRIGLTGASHDGHARESALEGGPARSCRFPLATETALAGRDAAGLGLHRRQPRRDAAAGAAA
jgi:hypothetical protein